MSPSTDRRSIVAHITYIEGASVEPLFLKEFSRKEVMHVAGVTEQDILNARKAQATGTDDATDVTVTFIDTNDTVVVTVFNSEGEAYFYIGHMSDWKQ